jgi:CDGSH-type Zn-finger protein
VKSNPKIKIVKNGPYIVTGSVPLSEKSIEPDGKGYVYRDLRSFPAKEEYLLCRCGKTKDSPFCDGAHEFSSFHGTEIASRAPYEKRAELYKGPDLDLMDDGRCAYGRFCHTKDGNVWELIEKSDDAECREEAIKAACDCPTGRLVAVDKSGMKIERDDEPSIDIAQDPEKNVSCGIFVKGRIPLESADGSVYEIQNRYALCRCGVSRNAPFCDASHVPVRFRDKPNT